MGPKAHLVGQRIVGGAVCIAKRPKATPSVFLDKTLILFSKKCIFVKAKSTKTNYVYGISI